jgi:hypothetical protein
MVEGHVPQGVEVQVLSSAPSKPQIFAAFFYYAIKNHVVRCTLPEQPANRVRWTVENPAVLSIPFLTKKCFFMC